VPLALSTTRAWLVPFFAGIVALAVAVPAALASDPSSQAQNLRRQNGVLAARSTSAALTLYGLDSRLARVRSELASLEARRAELSRERTEVRKRVRITRRVLSYSEAMLGARLRVLYQQGEADPLEVLLGASSLDAALTRIDDLKLAASQDQHLMAEARSAREELARLTHKLAAREATLSGLTASAQATQASLASARAARVAYLGQLAAQESLNRSQISSLESQAQAMQAQAQAAAVRQVVTPTPTPIGVAPEPVVGTTGGRTMTVVATGYALRGRTATGAPTGWGVVAVDPSVIPLGTGMTIPGYGSGVAADTGGGVRGAMIDLWFPSVAQANAWGRRTVTITLH
jgi:3D (Asp-Asp-Asp) domain-containing protein/peptidoglycan hydrolase CwlO-like protein